MLTHPDSDHGWDMAVVDKKGKIVVFDCRDNSKRSHVVPQSFMQGQFGAGGTYVLGEGKTEQMLVHALGADLILMDAEARLGPLALDPPQLAEALISLIPVKHRENLLGDVEEDYRNRFIPRHGLRMARFLYWVQTVYAVLAFLARPLAGIAGLGLIRKAIEILVHRMTK
jgi:hypothetical protein